MLEFEPWNQLLQQYVDARGRVDYAAWKAESALPLKAWLAQIAKPALAQHPDRNLRLAFWINLYNALVIDQVLDQYPIDSIRPTWLGLPNWLAFLRFFQKPVWQIAGERYSLNQIEHGILRPEFQEPRIHFALVCAAVGCPWLRAEAYWPEQIEQQLAADAARFVNNPDKLWIAVSSPTGSTVSTVSTINCSQIFKWYKKDFLQRFPTIQAYVQPYLPDEIPPMARIRYLKYDWSLNQRTSS